VVIDDLDLVCVCLRPTKANPPLIVHTNAVLALALALERSLKEYVLFDQASVHAEHFVRQPDQRWLLSETDSLADALTLACLGAVLKLSEVYEGVGLGDAA
jgi:hypothetical protein